MNIVQHLIDDCTSYNKAVSAKLKDMAAKGEGLPEKVEDFCFVGKCKHKTMLDTLLGLLEFLVTTSENYVEIGFPNIEKLWHMFVSEPNFESDQNLFLTWINKHRVKEDAKKNQYDVYIFTDEEKEFLFINVLCNTA
jgi:hypothetical protein